MVSEKEEFIEAIVNDQYAEWEIKEDLVLITDWEGDGYFNPYVLDLECQYTESEIGVFLENEASDVFNFEVLEFAEHNNDPYDLYYPEGISCKYEYIKPLYHKRYDDHPYF